MVTTRTREELVKTPLVPALWSNTKTGVSERGRSNHRLRWCKVLSINRPAKPVMSHPKACRTTYIYNRYIYMNTYVYIYTYIHSRVYTNTHIYTSTNIQLHVCIFAYIHMYVLVHLGPSTINPKFDPWRCLPPTRRDPSRGPPKV